MKLPISLIKSLNNSTGKPKDEFNNEHLPGGHIHFTAFIRLFGE